MEHFTVFHARFIRARAPRHQVFKGTCAPDFTGPNPSHITGMHVAARAHLLFLDAAERGSDPEIPPLRADFIFISTVQSACEAERGAKRCTELIPGPAAPPCGRQDTLRVFSSFYSNLPDDSQPSAAEMKDAAGTQKPRTSMLWKRPCCICSSWKTILIRQIRSSRCSWFPASNPGEQNQKRRSGCRLKS